MKQRVAWAASVALAVQLGGARGATADDGGWYGWQPMITDLGAMTLAGVGAQGEGSRPLLLAAGAAYLLAPPVIHLAHAEGRGAAWSAGLRVGMPLVLAGLGASSGSPDGALFAAAGGVVLAAVLDWSFNSFDDSDPPAAARTLMLGWSGRL